MRNVIVHIHIFKNAGTTFDDTLKRNFGNDFIDHREDNEILKGKLNYLLEFLKKHSNIKAFSSHSIHFLLKNSEEFNFLPVYFIRHPIERIQSVYNFEKKQEPALTEGAKKAKELNFNEFIKWYMKDDSPATIRNAQTIFLSGDGPQSNRIDYKFDLAQKNLFDLSTMIGVVDRYDESMVVFEEKLKKFFPDIDLSYIARNITNQNYKKSINEKLSDFEKRLSNETKQLVYEKNYFDLKLYKLANERLDLEIQKIEDFDKKLEDFKLRCTIREIRGLINQGNFSDVIFITDKLIKKDLNNIHIYLLYAEAKSKLEKYKEAIEAYKLVQKKFPNNAIAYFAEAEQYLLIGNREKAKELFEKYSRKFKENEKIILSNKEKFERISNIYLKGLNSKPKKIVQYWEGELTEEYLKLINSWQEKHLGYKYELFNRNKAARYIEKNYGTKIKKLFLSAALPAMQSDIFRVAYCLKEGGLYVDIGTECVSSLDPLFENKYDLILLRKWHGGIWNGFILSKPNNSFLQKIFQKIIQNLKERKIQNIWLATGPGIYNDIFKNMSENELENNNILILKQREESTNFFKIINQLSHKKESHWSKKQKNFDIYSGKLEGL